MALKTRKQAVGRTQVQSDIRSGGKVIAARPAHLNTTPPPIDRQHLDNLRNTADGIGKVAVEVERQRQIQQKKFAEKEAALGAADAKLAGERSLEQYEEYRDTAKSGYRIQGYMGQAGQQAAYEAQREHDQFMRENPQPTEDQFNQSIAGVVAAKLEGMNDKHYVKGFLTSMNNYEAQARAAWEEDNYLEAQRETTNVLNSVLRDDLAALPEGYTADDVNARLQQFSADGREQNLHRDDIFTMQLQAATQHAMRTGDASILGTDDFGIFENDVVGADGKTRPGPANSPERVKDLTDARNKVNRHIASGVAKKDKARELAYLRDFDRDLENENLEQAHARAQKEYADGMLTVRQFRSDEKKIEDMRKKIDHRHQVGLAVDGFVPYPEGTTDGDVQDSIDRSWQEVGEIARNDPDQFLEAEALHRDREASTGVMDSNTVRRIKGNRPSMQGNPAQFHADSLVIARRAEESPDLVRRNIGNDMVNQHLLYVDLLESGHDSHTAYGMMVEWNSPAGRDRLNAFTKEKEYYEEVDDYLDDRADDKLDNSGYAKQQFRARIKANFMANGGNIDLAYQMAEKDMESQFTTVTLPNTDDGDGNEIELLFDTGGMKLPAKLGETMAALTTDQTFRDTHGIPDDAVVYWAPNPNDRRGPWRVYDARTNQPITYSTGGQVKFAEVDVRAATSEYSAEQARLKAEARKKKAVEEAAANKASRARHQKNLDKAEEMKRQAESTRIPFAKHLTDLFD